MTKKHYWEYGEQDAATRKKYHTGDILENAAVCGVCNDYIRSNNKHDFKSCSCGNVSVDGGSWYARRSFKTDNFKNKITLYKDVEND